MYPRVSLTTVGLVYALLALACSGEESHRSLATRTAFKTAEPTACGAFDSDTVVIPNKDAPLVNVEFERAVLTAPARTAWLVSDRSKATSEASWLLFDSIGVVASDIHLDEAPKLGRLAQCLGNNRSRFAKHRQIEIRPERSDLPHAVLINGEIVPVPRDAAFRRPIYSDAGPTPPDLREFRRGDTVVRLTSSGVTMARIAPEDKAELDPFLAKLAGFGPAEFSTLIPAIDALQRHRFTLAVDPAPVWLFIGETQLRIPIGWLVTSDCNYSAFGYANCPNAFMTVVSGDSSVGDSVLIFDAETYQIIYQHVLPADQEVLQPFLEAILVARSDNVGG